MSNKQSFKPQRDTLYPLLNADCSAGTFYVYVLRCILIWVSFSLQI